MAGATSLSLDGAASLSLDEDFGISAAEVGDFNAGALSLSFDGDFMAGVGEVGEFDAGYDKRIYQSPAHWRCPGQGCEMCHCYASLL